MAEKIESKYKNMRATIYNNETKTFTTQKVIQFAGDKVEFEEDLLPIEAAAQFVNESDGTVHFVYNLDLPARVESHELKKMRRSVALQRIFDYDKKKAFDLLGFMPWIITIIVVIFK